MLSIAKRLLYGQRIREKSTELPYDAEVDWLEATGTQWIDTGLANAANRLIRVRFQKTGSVSEDLVLPFHTYISRSVFVGVRIQNLGSGWLFRGACTTGMQTLGPADLDWHEAEIDTTVNQKSLWFDGVKKYEVAAGISTTPTITNKLFAYANSSTAAPTTFGSGRISAYTVTDTATGQVIQDLIPVRKNGVGYMYDRVTGQLLGNSGTGDFVLGPDKPYDYEVEYIERDFTKPWMVNGSEAKNIGFDISEYMPEDNHVNTFPKIAATYSFSPQPAGLQVAISFGSIMLNNLVAYYSIAKMLNDIHYRIAFGTVSGSYYESSFEGSLGEFHTAEIVPDGTGNAAAYIDGTSLGSGSMSTTTVNNFFVLAGRGLSSNDKCQMRVKNARLGSTVYLIPVVKGNAVGFYNMVDGHLLLEEQACLSAGPKK